MTARSNTINNILIICKPHFVIDTNSNPSVLSLFGRIPIIKAKFQCMFVEKAKINFDARNVKWTMRGHTRALGTRMTPKNRKPEILLLLITTTIAIVEAVGERIRTTSEFAIAMSYWGSDVS